MTDWIGSQLWGYVVWGVLGSYYAALSFLVLLGLHRLYLWGGSREPVSGKSTVPEPASVADARLSEVRLPEVLVQLPIYNERYVVERLLLAVCDLNYPRDKLIVQVLDDSTDDTPLRLLTLIGKLRMRGSRIEHLRRTNREGFKAGALAAGLASTEAPFVAVFDADFVPDPDFLLRTLPHFADPQVGLVQTRWDYLNRDHSLLTRSQAVLLDTHFLVEQPGRAQRGLWFNFNGTAGVWCRQAIEEAGGWHYDTLTEDLDLSYRAQLRGWKFVYRSDIGTPSELPIDIAALKSQQTRWSRGGAQTLRKLAGAVFSADEPIRQRLNATLHLASPLGHVALLTVALALPPTLLIRQRLFGGMLTPIDTALLVAGTGSFIWTFLGGLHRRDAAHRIAEVATAIGLGIGLAAVNARAVFTGLFRRGGEFHRTPKYANEAKNRPAAPKYRSIRDTTWIYEAGLTAYSLAGLALSVALGWWASIPFLALFAAGFGWVFVLALDERLPPRHAKTSPAFRRSQIYVVE